MSDGVTGILLEQMGSLRSESQLLRNELSLLRSEHQSELRDLSLRVQALDTAVAVQAARAERQSVDEGDVSSGVSVSLFRWTIGGILGVVTALIALLGDKFK